jgi:hypothetical protein
MGRSDEETDSEHIYIYICALYQGSFHYAARWRKEEPPWLQADHVSPRFWEITIGTYGK